ncbi:MAG TPA: radical SAM protein [Actinomycetota bacterium]|nr:radical SAM protein [Actinomycetota bacterium]
MSASLVLDIAERVSGLPAGGSITIELASAEVADLVAAWCERTANTLVEHDSGSIEVYRGRLADPIEALPVERRPGHRLWIYTNFHCNLACDYCCVRSSPRADPRMLSLDHIRRVAAEAEAAGVRELWITGGEPFIRPDIAEVLDACARRLPTTVLTNGMLLPGPRLAALSEFSRDTLAFQVSLDSPDRELHDRHRGVGSWDRAVAGIRTLRGAGFRVRVAATLGYEDQATEASFHRFLDGLGIPAAERLVRRIAKRGFAEDGVVLTPQSLVPEVTVTADGVYWHPVGADDEDMLVTTLVLPLEEAIALVRERFVATRRRQDALARIFACG